MTISVISRVSGILYEGHIRAGDFLCYYHIASVLLVYEYTLPSYVVTRVERTLQQDIMRRLAVYDQAFSLVEWHDFVDFWPTERVVLAQGDVDYMKSLNYQKYFILEQLQPVPTP